MKSPLLVLLLLPLALRAAPVAVEGFTFVRTLGGIDEYRLDANGLQVLLKPLRAAPVVTFNVCYHVGSRNEVTGTTGSTHLLEHLMFKGSEHFNTGAGNDVKVSLERIGARYNATTSFDRTHYYATVGKDSLAIPIALEADRMRHLLLREADRRSEMTVVRNEYERGENDPVNALEKDVLATAFQAQPYHHETIGWRSDIEHVPIEKLRAFYDTFYWPDNATAIVVGDFEPAQVLQLIKDQFGVYAKAPTPIPAIYTEEPEQTGPRRTIVKRPGQLGAVIVVHKVPAGLHGDLPALDVLGSILGSGKTSRLYRALVDAGLAASLEVGPYRLHDPGVFETSVALTPGADPARVEEIVLQEIAKLQRDGVTADEVRSVLRREHAATAYARETSSGIAGALNEAVSLGDWTDYVQYPAAIQQVTAADVQRVARLYLDPDHSTTGWFIPLTPKAP